MKKMISLWVLAAFSGLLLCAPEGAAAGKKTRKELRLAPAGPGAVEVVAPEAAPKKKGVPWLLVGGGAAAVGLALWLLTKKKDGAADDPGNGNYGTTVPRVVVAEDFTATWCGYCPGAARGLEQLESERPASLAAVAYHANSTDPFYVSGIYSSRKSLYGVGGIPDVFFDGKERVTGGSAGGSMYASYKPKFDGRLAIGAPLEIQIVLEGSAGVTLRLRNVGGTSLSGQLQAALVEDEIAYSWRDMAWLNAVCRSMLPGPEGESVTIKAGETRSFSRIFSILAGWNRAKCRIVAFLQGADKEIYQGAELALQ